MPGLLVAVLTGGESRRMGRAKGDMPFGGETMLERVVRVCRGWADGVVVVAREGQEVTTTAQVVRDRGEGPLGGIAAGLRAAGEGWVLVVGCDMPLLQREVVDLLVAAAREGRGAVAESGGRVLGTLGVYSAEMAGEVEGLLAAGERRARAVAGLAGVRVVGEAEVRGVDPGLLSLRPCNTPGEYEQLLRLAGLTD